MEKHPSQDPVPYIDYLIEQDLERVQAAKTHIGHATARAIASKYADEYPDSDYAEFHRTGELNANLNATLHGHINELSEDFAANQHELNRLYHLALYFGVRENGTLPPHEGDWTQLSLEPTEQERVIRAPISHAAARVIASQYSHGESDPYSTFVSTGEISAELTTAIDGKMRELAANPQANMRRILQLGVLLDYIEAREWGQIEVPADWSELWLNQPDDPEYRIGGQS